MRKPEWIQINTLKNYFIEIWIESLNHALLAQSCICASNPSRLAWEAFKKAVEKLEHVWHQKETQVRMCKEMNLNNDPCLEVIKVKNLKYSDFVEQVAEEMVPLIKRLKKKRLQYICIYIDRYIYIYIYIYIANTRPWNHFPFVSLESNKLTCMSFEVVYEPSATRGS
jgi:hypothetical protein